MFNTSSSNILQQINQRGSGKNIKTLLDEISWGDDNPDVKTYKVIEIEGDFLALSCAAQRLAAKNEIQPYIKFYDRSVITKVKDEDYQKAEKIRDYYSKKIMIWKLKECKLTPFREELNTYIHGPKESIKESFIGMAHRLPEMYDYDMEFIGLEQYAISKKTKYINKNFVLTFKKKLFWKQKGYSRVEYYFTDELNNLWCLPFDRNNQLLQVFDRLLSDKLSIHTTPALKRNGELTWYEASKWELNE